MSTEINITIGDRRLLQESKTRAAANQQSLDSRLEEQQLTEQLTEAVDEATPEDPRSDAFSLQLDRRPAAQRRRKEDDKFQIARLGNLFPRPVPNSEQSFFPGTWFYASSVYTGGGFISCPAEPPPSPNDRPYTLTNHSADFTERGINVNSEYNNYADISVRFAPTLSFLNSSYSLPERILNRVNTRSFIWLSEVTKFIVVYFTKCGFPFSEDIFRGDVVSSGPNFPRQSLTSNLIADFQLVSSTSTYIYFSALLRHNEYTLKEVLGPTFFIVSGIDELKSPQFVVANDRTAVAIGYYVRFNVKNFTVERKFVTLQNQFFPASVTGGFSRSIAFPPSSFVSSALREAFAANFYPDDPRSSLRASNLEQALDYDINHFSYDPNTGAAYFYGQHTVVFIDGSPNQLSPDAFVYFTRFDKGTPYGEVVGVLKKAKLVLRSLTTAPAVLTDNSFNQTFTRKQFIALGGVKVESPPRNFIFTSDISQILAIVPQV